MGTTLMQNKGEFREWGEGVFKNSELSAQFFCKTNTALKKKCLVGKFLYLPLNFAINIKQL